MFAMSGGGRLEGQVVAMLRGQVVEIIAGAVFLFMGLAVCAIAVIRRRSGVRLFTWLGIWSAMYGAGLLSQSPAVVAALPHSLQIAVLYVNTVTAYLTVVIAFLQVRHSPSAAHRRVHFHDGGEDHIGERKSRPPWLVGWLRNPRAQIAQQ